MRDHPFDPARVAWVTTLDEYKRMGAVQAEASHIVFDLETTGLTPHAWTGGHLNGGVASRISLASFTVIDQDVLDGGCPTTWLLPLSHPESPFRGQWRAMYRKLVEMWRRKRIPLSNQNIKYDCRWTYALTGVDLSPLIVFDPEQSSHLINENISRKLKVRAPLTLGIEAWDEFDLSTPGASERVPLFDLGIYAAQDTHNTWRLEWHHMRQLYCEYVLDPDAPYIPPESPEDVSDARLGSLMVHCTMPTVRSLTQIEQRGLQLDRKWVEDKIIELDAVRVEGSRDLATRYGMDPNSASWAPTSYWFADWTKAAVDAGDLKVAALTATGKPQWSKGVLVRQARNGSEVAETLLDVRGATKKLEYLRSWLSLTTRDDRIYPSYNVGSVVTGRLSSSDPNAQQVTASLKPAFVPGPGKVFMELDFSQVELRVAAFISRCQPMIEAFREGRDLHRMLAARVVGVRKYASARRELERRPERMAEAEALDRNDPRFIVLPEEVTAGERQGGKAGNFGLLYGMRAAGFREYAETVYGVSFTMDEAQAVYDAFFETWDGMAQWHERVRAQVNREGFVTSPLGRIRRLPDVWSSNPKAAAHAERNAINSPVQGFASDLMQLAAASIQGLIPGEERVRGAELVGTVHDSILGTAPEDDWERVARECQSRMTNLDHLLAKMDCHFDVPLVADVKVGSRWGLKDVGEL